MVKKSIILKEVDVNDMLKAKSIIMIMAKEFKVLGEYNNSKDD